MKNILKLSLMTVGIILSSSILAQETIKKDAATTSGQLETPKAAKQDPVKTTPGNSTSTSSKTDTTKTGGGTRMAISEQGMPKKNKNKSKTTTTTAPPAKTEAPKK